MNIILLAVSLLSVSAAFLYPERAVQILAGIICGVAGIIGLVLAFS